MEKIIRDIQMLSDENIVKKVKMYKTRCNPFEMDDEDFYERYRFDKETACFIIDLVDSKTFQTKRGKAIPMNLQVLSTLRFLGRNVHQSDIGDLHGLSQPSVSRIIKNVTKKLALRLPDFVKFPQQPEEVNKIKSRFYNIARFPCVIGAIDCTHVRIKCPTRNVGPIMAGHFRNRKGYYSLNVQIVCDADCKILDIVARTRGSVHDARIWSMCYLKSKLEASQCQHKGVLLGDGGYPASSILLTPVRTPATDKEIRYNRSHTATRAKIECLNGQLKSKFQSVLERIRVDLDTAKNIIVAVAVLHNIAKERNMQFLNDTAPNRAALQQPQDIHNLIAGETGRAFRSGFIERYF